MSNDLPVRRYTAIGQPSVTVRVPLPQPMQPPPKAAPPPAPKPTFVKAKATTPHSIILPL